MQHSELLSKMHLSREEIVNRRVMYSCLYDMDLCCVISKSPGERTAMDIIVASKARECLERFLPASVKLLE